MCFTATSSMRSSRYGATSRQCGVLLSGTQLRACYAKSVSDLVAPARWYQPSNKNSNVILIHFRLKNPIMIGKQSAKDIQVPVRTSSLTWGDMIGASPGFSSTDIGYDVDQFYLEWLEDSESLLENKRRSQVQTLRSPYTLATRWPVLT